MTAGAHAPRTNTSRLTPGRLALMVMAALAVFGIAYAAGAVFGRLADDTLPAGGIRETRAVAPSGTPARSLVARAVKFDAAEIRVPAGQPARLRLDNEDAGIFHNIAVYRTAAATDLIARGELFNGPRTRDYVFAPIAAGSYYFQCDLHPAMNGTFLVQ